MDFGTHLKCTNPECGAKLIYEQTCRGTRLRSEIQLLNSHKKDTLILIREMRYKHSSLKHELTKKRIERNELVEKLVTIDNELNAINTNMEQLESQIYLKFTKYDD